jgi:hypothetical protein
MTQTWIMICDRCDRCKATSKHQDDWANLDYYCGWWFDPPQRRFSLCPNCNLALTRFLKLKRYVYHEKT